MSFPELLAPAGSWDCIPAAVQNGADAVYLGFDDFNARKGAKNFTPEEFEKALSYCRLRGVKVYVTLNTLLTDRELEHAAGVVRAASRLGADAVIVQDLGLVRLIRMVAPDLPIHASTQMSVHNLEGVRYAASMGISRVVLARELDRRQIAAICRSAPIETEIFIHGALCMSYSGQCYMSSVIGRRSGNRGLCAQPCRLPYGFGPSADEYPLSLKDLSLGEHLSELARLGVTGFKIEGRMKRPEYVAVACGIYSTAIKEGRNITKSETAALETAFSRQGFTDGYYSGKTGPEMFGVRTPDDEQETARLFAAARASYREGREAQRVPVRFYCLIREGQRAMLAVEDDRDNTCIVEGDFPQPAYARPLIDAEVKTQLYKTGGTPYRCESVQVHLEQGLSLPFSAINAMRRSALEQLSSKRTAAPERQEFSFKAGLHYLDRKDAPLLNISLTYARQLQREFIALRPNLIYVPLHELAAQPEAALPLLEAGLSLVAALPRIIHDDELKDIRGMLDQVYALGVTQALVSNIGHIALARAAGFSLRGDFGLNVMNSQTLKELKHSGLLSAALSFELSFPQIRDLSKCMDTELIAYGRLPLMITRNCVIFNRAGKHDCDNINELTDRTGRLFPVIRDYNCRNVILNSEKLFLADKREEYEKLGLWAIRLNFTTENPRECVQVTERYLGLGKYEPNAFTRGLYYRSVE